MKRLNFLDMGRLALDSPARYEFQYGISRDALVQKAHRNKRCVGPTAMAIFGNSVTLYRGQFLTSIQFLRLCNKIDGYLEKLKAYTGKDQSEEWMAVFKEMFDLCLNTYEAIFFIEEAGNYEWNEESEREDLVFDTDIVREHMKEESKNRTVRKEYGKQAQKGLRVLSEKASDELLSKLMREETQVLTQKVIDSLGTEDIRYIKNETEEYLKAHYDFSEQAMLTIRDVLEDCENTVLYYKNQFRYRRERIKKLESYDAPVVILYHEYRMAFTYEMLMILSDYVRSQDAMTDKIRAYVADAYLKFKELSDIIKNEGYSEYSNAVTAFLESIQNEVKIWEEH